MKIKIKVFTGCSFVRIEKIEKCFYKVWLTQSPEKDKANRQLVKILSKEFNIPKSAIKILKGRRNSEKILGIIQDKI